MNSGGRTGRCSRHRRRIAPDPAWWRLLQVLSAVGLAAVTCWALLQWPYRVDMDVYRMGGQAWLDGRPLYAADTLFTTRTGVNLPFTYPPPAAILFAPFALLPLPVDSALITVITLAALIASLTIVLTGLDVWPAQTVPGTALQRRAWLAAALVTVAAIAFEPIRSNISLGQINAVLMTLVLADCVPSRTRWPRGMLLGLAVAVKLTPAVFLLYFLLRRDFRAALTTLATVAATTLAGFALARRDSWQYWTETVGHTDRIGTAALNTNQNIAGTLARLALGEQRRHLLWLAGSLLVLAIAVWAVRRVLRGGEPVLALICVALFGLLVSPISWSHHWVWSLPAVVAVGVLGHRRRSAALSELAALGVALMLIPPMLLLPGHHEPDAAWWRQLLGMSYVWWALTVLITVGATAAGPPAASRWRSPECARPGTASPHPAHRP